MRRVTVSIDYRHHSESEDWLNLNQLNINTMTENIHSVNTLHELLDFDVRKFVSAEIQLEKSLAGFVNRAASPKLKYVLLKYLEFIKKHIQDMESIIEEENITSISLKNRIMYAFIEEAEEKLGVCKSSDVKDACLLSCVQAINHFKISMYGTAAAFAKELGMDKQSGFFREAEVNEKQIDDRLSQLAEHEINVKAKTFISLPGL
jgi:ferritin-like metal-binding protein YciE